MRHKGINDLAIRQLGEMVNASQRVLYLNCGGKKVGNSGDVNPREGRSERRCPTKKSDTAAAPRRDLKRSYHRQWRKSSEIRPKWVAWQDWL